MGWFFGFNHESVITILSNGYTLGSVDVSHASRVARQNADRQGDTCSKWSLPLPMWQRGMAVFCQQPEGTRQFLGATALRFACLE